MTQLLYLCRPFSISETNIRTYLSRGISNRYFSVRKEGRSAYYSLGEKMTSIASNVAWSFKLPDWSNWDKSWWGITFSIPEKEKPLRHKIRKKLTYYRFAPLSGGFWIRPYNQDERMEDIFNSVRQNINCRMMHFSYLDDFSADDAAKLWNLKEINTGFKNGIRLIENHQKNFEAMNPEDAFRLRIELGNTIIPQLALDPLLPEMLLPENWYGREIREGYFQFDKELKEKSKLYWKNLPD